MNRHPLCLDDRYLKPGELLCPERPSLISTILGSCVAITLYNHHAPLGGICHAVLPYSNGKQDARYVDQALRRMLECFDRAGIKRGNIAAKLFGGADTMPMTDRHGKEEIGAVGRKNISAARALIAREGLHIAASDVGGLEGRKIFFYSHTGEIFLRRFPIRETTRSQARSTPPK